ncbi:MAG TPA: aspartate kinase [Rectinemataceae bacterium]|nr:aspartate kinase [Rectinemataceae bacterium]
MNRIVVMKFGGSSVAGTERLRGVAALARARAAKGDAVLLVLSAMSKVTDSLFAAGRAAESRDEAAALATFEEIIGRHEAAAAELFGGDPPEAVKAALARAREEIVPVLRGAALLGTLPERSKDLLVGRGELLSTALLAAYMEATWLDARTVLRTDSRFGQARPRPEAIKHLASFTLLPLLGPGRIVVTQGYIGADDAGVPTTLGRGGSDYSASLFGAAIEAAEIQIWTDVEGVLTGDPRVVEGARPVEILGYDEAAELAAFGAKVLHPATILPAVELGIPVTVRNTMLPEGKFTTISKESASGLPVTALASRGPVTVVTVRNPRMLGGAGFLSRIFEVFGRRGVSVDLVSTSEVSVSVTVDEGAAQLEALVAELGSFADVRVEKDRAIVALVGEELKRTPGVTGAAFGALRDINVEMISLGSNEINLSLVVALKDAAEAQRRLHAALFGSAATALFGSADTAVAGSSRKEGS